MLRNLLTYKEFQEIIEHCMKCKSGYAIKDFLDDIVNNFGDANTNLCLSLMEFLEYHKQPLQGINHLHELDVLRFEDDLPKIKNNKIEYAYSYLSYLYSRSDLIQQRKRSNESVVFKANCTPIKMNKILLDLKEKGFCTFSNIQDVRWIFKGMSPEVSNEKLTWTDKAVKSKDVNFQTLLILLKQIIVDSDTIINTRFAFRYAFINAFKTNLKTNLDHENVKSAINRFKKRHPKTENEREKLLLQIIN